MLFSLEAVQNAEQLPGEDRARYLEQLISAGRGAAWGDIALAGLALAGAVLAIAAEDARD